MVGNYSQNVGRIKLTTPLDFVMIVAPIAGLFAIGMVVFAIVVLIFCYRAKQKDHRYNQLIVEMEKLESSVARECKLGEERGGWGSEGCMVMSVSSSQDLLSCRLILMS